MSFESINHLRIQITLVTPTPYVFLPKGDGILDRSIRDLQEESVSDSRYSNRSNNCRRRVYRERSQKVVCKRYKLL